MTFISYAQNYEDVMLRRALKDVSEGFYIDVGAQDPVEDSVTKAFYDAGWRGINVEPVRFWFDKLVESRPRDTNLRCAVSDHPGSLRIYEVRNSGLSTVIPEVAEQHRSAGFEVREEAVDCTTLDAICDEQAVGEVHFLKLDCEGAEAAALRGFALDARRPWIIVVEAMSPNAQIPDFAEWEPLITASRYHFVYEDGLNRYYVADEKAELDAAFEYPPNIFDGFMRGSEHRVRMELAEDRAELGRLHHAADAQRVELERFAMELEAGEKRFADLSLQQQETEQRLRQAEEQAQVEREHSIQLREAIDAAHAEASNSRVFISQLNDALGRREQDVRELRAHVEALDAQIKAVYTSTSWRITWPVRAVRASLSRSSQVGRSALKRLVVGIVRACRPLLRYLLRNRWLASILVSRLGADSALGRRLQQFMGIDLGFRSTVRIELSWHAGRAYAEMVDLGLVTSTATPEETESLANRS